LIAIGGTISSHRRRAPYYHVAVLAMTSASPSNGLNASIFNNTCCNGPVLISISFRQKALKCISTSTILAVEVLKLMKKGRRRYVRSLQHKKEWCQATTGRTVTSILGKAKKVSRSVNQLSGADIEVKLHVL